jgi:PAS domain S-box-containing protein
LRESAARKTAILDSALDAIVAMDQEGRFIDFNPAAEKLFGRRCDDVLGKAVADTIVPERLRESHWNGLRRFVQTGSSNVIGRHVEMPALRADGTEFPAELAITATPLDKGQLIFHGLFARLTKCIWHRARNTCPFRKSHPTWIRFAKQNCACWPAGAARPYLGQCRKISDGGVDRAAGHGSLSVG